MVKVNVANVDLGGRANICEPLMYMNHPVVSGIKTISQNSPPLKVKNTAMVHLCVNLKEGLREAQRASTTLFLDVFVRVSLEEIMHLRQWAE